MAIARRSFLHSMAAAALTAAVPTAIFSTARRAYAAGFGPLVPDPSGILDLPAGFAYRVLERSGDDMSDGYRMPGNPDGMACFPGPSGTIILMRNHENNLGDTGRGPYKMGQSPPAEAYDPQGMGGVSRVVIDERTLTRRSSNMVLLGSVRNCAGGPSPWGWITCEESVETNHGYSFVCPIDADRARMPQRVVGYGRFYHEAAAVDPSTHIAYLTEDRDDGCVYRFVPTVKDKPFEGKLQALKIVGRDRFDTATQMMVGQALDAEWVDVANPNPMTDSIRGEAQRAGAALLRRGEGIWFAGGYVYICSTSGGPVNGGQIFRFDPKAGAGGRLLLLAQSTDRSKLDMPDNITMSPWGDLLMAEDGSGEQYVRALTPTGEVYELARNAKSTSELSGVCCSPDGRAVFVNLQKDGLTLVITGPFPGTNMMQPDGGTPTPDMGGGTPPDLAGPPEEPPVDEATGCSASGGVGSAGALGTAVLAVGAAALVQQAKPAVD